MEEQPPPSAGDFCTACPRPELSACKSRHFGREVWHIDCPDAVEVFAKGQGIAIKCAHTGEPCCIEDGQDVFVGSPSLNPIKDFLETTLGYLGLKHN